MAQPPPLIIPAEVDDADLTVYAFRILCHLARRGAAQNGAWGSIEGMAAKMRIDPKTVKKALRELIDKQWISRSPRPGQTSLYSLATQATPAPRPPDGPGDETAQGVGHETAQGVGHETAHEGVTGRSQEKGLPPKPPEGVSSSAGLTPEPTPNPPVTPDSANPAKKEKGTAKPEDPIRDVPSALAALAPLLHALHRDPRHGLTPQEEHELIPLFRSPAGLQPHDITAIARAVTQRAAYTRFDDIPNDSPLRSVRRKLGTLLSDWPHQTAIARQITGKTKSPARRDPNAPPDYPWEAACWHLYEAEPVPWSQQTYRDRQRFADLWRTWTEEQRQTAIHRYQHRLTTPIETELTAA